MQCGLLEIPYYALERIIRGSAKLLYHVKGALTLLYYGIKPESLGQLGVLGKQISRCADKVVQLKVNFLRPYGVAYLDQVMIKERDSVSGKSVCSTYPRVNQYLKQCGFCHLPKEVKCDEPFPQNEIFSVEQFSGAPVDCQESFLSWLDERVFNFLPVLSPKANKGIVKNLWEIVNNGLIHSRSLRGVSVAGQFYPAMNYFEVAFYDSGVGIPALVRNFKKWESDTPDSDCIQWALKKGNTTSPPGGSGLHLLRQFLKLNCGSIQIVSGDGFYAQYGGEKGDFQTLRNAIAGTLVNIRVLYDENMYKIAGEKIS